jgi:hypothetical protein
MFFFQMGRMPLEIAGGSAISAHVAPDFGGWCKVSLFLEFEGRGNRGGARRAAETTIVILRGKSEIEVHSRFTFERGRLGVAFHERKYSVVSRRDRGNLGNFVCVRDSDGDLSRGGKSCWSPERRAGGAQRGHRER